MKDNPVISIVGAGNVAGHLAVALKASGGSIAQVSARSIETASRLAQRVGARAVEVPQMSTDVDMVLIAVADRAVADVAAMLPPGRAIVAHTSGSIPLERIAAGGRRAAVLYPLQSFSRDVAVDVSEVPFFTEATDEATLAEVDAIARRLSEHVYHADSARRRHLHIAGVLAGNFPVYLLEMARSTLAEAGYPLEVVKPLMEAVTAKAFAVGPHDALTGPARRGDVAVTRLQAEALPPAHRTIYEAFTQAIIDEYSE